MNLVEFLTAISYQITGGCEYCWDCFGPNAQYLDSDDISAVFDTKTQEVYAVELCDTTTNQNFRWINPAYYGKYVAECVDRGVDPNIAYDDVLFDEVTSTTDFLQVISEYVALRPR